MIYRYESHLDHIPVEDSIEALTFVKEERDYSNIEIYSPIRPDLG